MKSNVVNFLGLGMKAGKIISGEETCKKELKKNFT